MKAVLKNYRQSPRKVRLVADLVRGKNVPHAVTALQFLNKRAALPVKKLIDTAVANARENNSISDENTLYIKEIRVDEGFTLKRFMPRAQGRATRINKRTSHIHLLLEELSAKETSTETKKETVSQT